MRHAMNYTDPGYYVPGGYGDESIDGPVPSSQMAVPYSISPVWATISTVSMAVSAYHGYRRNSRGNHPIAWALTWGFLGAMFPVIVPVIAVAEGFGKPE